MSTRIVPLRRLLKKHDEADIKRFVSRYVPYRSEINDNFLVSNAVMFEKRVIGRTYLLFGDDDNIQGYFTVGIKSMVIPDEMSDEISNSFRRRMNLANGDDMLATHLIGQLSRSNNSPKGTGDILMEQAMKIIDRCSALEGCRVVRVDCVDGLCGYYRGRGFKLLCKDRDEDLNQMIKILS